MTYIGKVQNGVVVLPPDANLPEGAEVKVEPLVLTEENDSLVAAFKRLAKPRPDWPADFVVNHGHYVNGEPKRE